MTVASRRDVGEVRDTLARWFIERAAAAAVDVVDVRASRSGFSNESFLCDVRWTDAVGVSTSQWLVLRIEPTTHQLFSQADVLRQARVMTAIGAAAALPVPSVRFVERDRAWFGAPFYLMDRVEGKVPSDVPSYHAKGWVADLAVSDRTRLYDNALTALVQLHEVPWQQHFTFLQPVGSDPLAAYLTGVEEWTAAIGKELRVGREVILAASEYLRRHQPTDTRAGLVWGDARPGNIIFGSDLSVAAVLDWEAATIGPPEIDLGWWLMFEEYICESDGLRRLDGVPGREETIARYEALSHRAVVDIGYFEVLAGQVFSLINSRLATLLRGLGYEPRAADSFVARSTEMLQRSLRAAGGW